jgi:hypothetical protein
MTITALPSRNEYTATAGQTLFSYTFKIFESTDLNVYVTPAGQDADDVTDIVMGYSVTGLGDEDGGTITLVVAASIGDLVTIVSDIPENRTTDYQDNGDFLPVTVNADFDRVVALTKQEADRSGRTLAFQESLQNASALTLPNPAALQFLRWRSDLSGMENVDLAATGSPADSSVITYDPGFIGSSPRTVEEKLQESVSVLDFAAVSGTDSSVAFNAACAYRSSIGGGEVYAPPGDWWFSASVNVPVGVYINGTRGTNFIPITGLSGKSMFLLNTLEAGDSGFVVDFPNMISGGFDKCFFDNRPNLISSVKAVQFAGSQVFQNLWFWSFAQSIVQDTAAYSDSVKLDSIICLSLDADTDWQMDLGFSGDGVDINQVHFPMSGRTLPPVGINAAIKQSIRVKNVIGGKHRFSLCNSGDVEIYTESGFVEVNSSSLTLRLHSYLNQTTSPVTLLNDSGGSHKVRLVDCEFNYGLSKSPIDIADVVSNAGFEVEIVNCHRVMTLDGVSGQQHSGIRVANSGEADIDAFNKYSYMHSRLSTLRKDSVVIPGYITVDSGSGSFGGVTEAVVGVNGVWDEASDTYYYRAQLLVDPVRTIGKNGGAEVSVVVASANKAVELGLAFNVGNIGIIRVYRGTATGSYTEFADVHITSLNRLYDIGSTVNGVTWVSRSAAGMDSIQIDPTKFRLVGDEIEVWTDTVNHPTTGTWSVGDMIYSSAPSVDGNDMLLFGRICITGGTPSSPTTHQLMYISTVTPAT